LELLDDDEKGVHNTDTPGGEQTVIVISEPGVYRLVFRSRKPEAERFKRWLAHEVLPKLRRTGRYEADDAPGAQAGLAGSPGGTGGGTGGGGTLRIEPLMHRLQVVREARALYGREVARQMWRRLGLPDAPPPPLSSLDDARQCLRHLLDAAVYPGGPMLRAALENALDEDLEAQALVSACGVRVLPESQTFVVANTSAWLGQCFEGTEWSGPRGHMRVLRRLPGAAAGQTAYRINGQQVRGTLLSADVLDDG
jgi:hypothetical protein